MSPPYILIEEIFHFSNIDCTYHEDSQCTKNCNISPFAKCPDTLFNKIRVILIETCAEALLIHGY